MDGRDSVMLSTLLPRLSTLSTRPPNSSTMRLNNSFLFLAITGTSAWAPTGRAGKSKRQLHHTTTNNIRPFADVKRYSRGMCKLHGTMPPLTVGEEYLSLARDMMSYIGESAAPGTQGKAGSSSFVRRIPPNDFSLFFYQRVIDVCCSK